MAHYLRPNTAEAGPQSCIVIDTEGTPVTSDAHPGKQVHLLRAWAATAWRYEAGKVTREREATGESAGKFWEWIYLQADKGRTTWIWGHGLGYDLQLLQVWREIELGRLAFAGKQKALNPGAAEGRPTPVWEGLLVTADPPIIIAARTPQGAMVKLCDLRNWCNAPLEELAGLVGAKVPDRPGDAADDRDVQGFCLARAKTLRAIVEEIVGMVREQNLGHFRATVGSQAHHAWRHPEVECELLPNDDPETRALEREAYFGGRCHVYYHGSCCHPDVFALGRLAGFNPLLPLAPIAPIYQLDVVACYGSVMANSVYPVRWKKTVGPITVDEAMHLSGAYCTIADVSINSPEVAYPRRVAGEVRYMVGKFRTTLAGPELRPAMIAGRVTEVHRLAYYVANRPFGRFVERLWRMRQLYKLAGARLKARLAKTMTAVMHGKLAQRSPRWELVAGKLAPQPWGTWIEYDAQSRCSVRYRAIGGVTQIEMAGHEPPDAMPAISAYITSYARQHLDLLRRTATERCCVYEDADSLHVTADGLRRLEVSGWIDENTMGKCRVERSSDRAVYHGRRDYSLGDHVVRCGIGRTATQLPRGDFAQTDFERLDSALTGQPAPGALATDRLLRLQRELLGSAPGPDGWTRYLIAE